MKNFLNNKIKIEEPAWVIIVKWLVLTLTIWIILLILMQPSMIRNIKVIYESMSKEGLSWYILWLWYLPILLIMSFIISIGNIIIHIPSKKKNLLSKEQMEEVNKFTNVSKNTEEMEKQVEHIIKENKELKEEIKDLDKQASKILEKIKQ